MPQVLKQLAPITSAVTRDSYRFYAKNYSGIKAYKLKNRDSGYFKIMDEFWRLTADKIVTSEGGVIIDRLGYFCIWMSPLKKYEIIPKGAYGEKKMQKHFNYHTDHHSFHPVLYTDINLVDPFYCWTMERAFNDKLKKKLAIRLKAGYRYTLKYTMVRKIYKNRNYVIHD